MAGARPQQTGGVHAGHEFLGGRAVAGFHHPAGAGYLSAHRRRPGGDRHLRRLHPARCPVCGRHRMGRVTHRPTPGGGLFRGTCLHP
ncbi:MAG: hypothetical protein MZV64_00285 [Ignavibacteriales bacterium]|nr:hypothetical protein [Ignavibacteriales bacterium]